MDGILGLIVKLFLLYLYQMHAVTSLVFPVSSLVLDGIQAHSLICHFLSPCIYIFAMVQDLIDPADNFRIGKNLLYPLLRECLFFIINVLSVYYKPRGSASFLLEIFTK